MRAPTILRLSVVALVVVVTACGDANTSEDTVALKAKITVSSTTDPANQMFAEIYAQTLEQAQFRVARKKSFDTPEAVLAAMESGAVQLTAMTTQGLLGILPESSPPVDVPNTTALQTVAIAKSLPPNLQMGTPTTAEDKDIVFCATTFTDANSIVSLTDLGTKPGTATLAATEGFDTATPLGGATLKENYEIEFKSVVPTPLDQTLEAVSAGTADCALGRSGDPALSLSTVKVLQDDKAIVPNDVIVPLVTVDVGTVDVLATLDGMSARLTPDSLRALLARLAVDGVTPEFVAHEFTGNVGS